MRPKRLRHAFLVPCLALLLGACSQFVIHSSHDPQADFAALHTFAWLPRDQADPADQITPNENFDRRIKADIEQDLRSKGFTPAGAAAADFLLNYRLSSTPVSAVQGDPSFGGWGGWWMMTPGWEAQYSDDYDEGALYIAVLDPNSQRVFWLGVAEARLLPSMSFERTLKRIDAAVTDILASFPAH
jgi:hypothetical protein